MKEVVELGDKVRDIVTGAEGVVTGLTVWLTGCDTATVNPQKFDKDGKVAENLHFDCNRLKILKKGAVVIPKSPVPKQNGGPRMNY